MTNMRRQDISPPTTPNTLTAKLEKKEDGRESGRKNGKQAGRGIWCSPGGKTLLPTPLPLISAPRYATVHQHFNIILIPNEAVVTPELLRGMEWNGGNMNAWGTEGGNCDHFMEASIGLRGEYLGPGSKT